MIAFGSGWLKAAFGPIQVRTWADSCQPKCVFGPVEEGAGRVCSMAYGMAGAQTAPPIPEISGNVPEGYQGP
jgi:hypothetical protein